MILVAGMLADAAVVERGKLYIHGGGWDTVFAAALPATQATLALALLFRVEYSEALKDIPVRIELVDEDGNATGAVKLDGKINVGHAPGTKPGQPIFVPQAITVGGLPLPREGTYSFRITSGDKDLGAVLFRIALASTAPPGLIPPTIQPAR